MTLQRSSHFRHLLLSRQFFSTQMSLPSKKKKKKNWLREDLHAAFCVIWQHLAQSSARDHRRWRRCSPSQGWGLGGSFSPHHIQALDQAYDSEPPREKNLQPEEKRAARTLIKARKGIQPLFHGTVKKKNTHTQVLYSTSQKRGHISP